MTSTAMPTAEQQRPPAALATVPSCRCRRAPSASARCDVADFAPCPPAASTSWKHIARRERPPTCTAASSDGRRRRDRDDGRRRRRRGRIGRDDARIGRRRHAPRIAPPPTRGRAFDEALARDDPGEAPRRPADRDVAPALGSNPARRAHRHRGRAGQPRPPSSSAHRSAPPQPRTSRSSLARAPPHGRLRPGVERRRRAPRHPLRPAGARRDPQARRRHASAAASCGVNPSRRTSPARGSRRRGCYGLGFADAGQHLEQQVYVHHNGAATRRRRAVQGRAAGRRAHARCGSATCSSDRMP